MTDSIRRVASAWGVLLAVFVVTDVWAQIDEIIVTTRRKSESLQTVPLAVKALTAEQINRQGIRSLDDITNLDPSVQFDTSFGPQDTRITVRGLSNTRGRSNVAFLVDGIDVTTENSISAGSGLLANQRLLNDVERIEIIKGPQSALYGRAAFAGAISYITREPGEEFEGKIATDIGQYGRREISGRVGGPVWSDILGLQASGVYWEQEGFYKNSVSGQDVGGGDGYAGALTAVLTPVDSLKFKARVEYSNAQNNVPPTVRAAYDTPRPYPQSAVDGRVGVSDAIAGTLTNLVDYGLYCPGILPLQPTAGEVAAVFPEYPIIEDPDNPGQMIPAPGFCVAPTYGTASDKVVAHSENPFTGRDFRGDTQNVLRASLNASWDVAQLTLSSTTGWTFAESSIAQDNDFQAKGRPDEFLSTIHTVFDQETIQFSEELRLATNFEGPLNFTVGGLYWQEKRDLNDNNYIISCLLVSKDLGGNLVENTPGLCDGTNGTVSSWQEYAVQDLTPQDIPGFLGPVWMVDTDHFSAYLAVDWDISDTFALRLEDRYVDEESSTIRPNQASCAALGFQAGGGALTVPLLSQEANPGTRIVCPSYDNAILKIQNGMDPNFDILQPGVQNFDWALVQGKETSRFHTPKVSLEWQASDDALVYGYWAKAQKPGGINQLEAGGSASTIENLRFKPEKMDAYEIGFKTSWEAQGYLQANGAAFFQDYTDKQITTVVVQNNFLTPRVTNASAAEVWGLEFDLTWQPEAIEGLTLQGAYTFLDSEYIDFDDDTTILVRAAEAGKCDVIYKGGAGPNPGDFSDPANGGPSCRIDQSGNQLERTPEHAFAGVASLQRPVPGRDFDWLVEVNATYQDDRFLGADNFAKWESYWLFNMRAGLSGDNWDFIVYADNLLDDDTIKTGGAGPDFGAQVVELGFVAGLGVQHNFGNLPNPRVFGARLSVQF